MLHLETLEQLEQSNDFLRVFKIAEGYGLESEFVVFYSRGIANGMGIREAVNYARDEWDI